MKRRSEPSMPPTLSWLARDVDAIAAECLCCGYRGEVALAPLLERHGAVPFPEFARRLRCSACGSRDVDARPAWRNPIKSVEPRGEL